MPKRPLAGGWFRGVVRRLCGQRSAAAVVGRVAIAAVFAVAGSGGARASERGVPPGFVHLADIDPGILEDMRYAGPNNFTGAPVPGYAGATCVLARPAAMALAAAQRDLNAKGFGLKVYDCYRPHRATRAFVGWAAGAGGDRVGAYNPRIPRRDLIARGYISAASSHSRGIAVDVTLVRLQAAPVAVEAPTPARYRCGAPADDSVDMGAGYDCLDPQSHADAPVEPEAGEARALLRRAMQRAGFTPYAREWWHFTLEVRPRPSLYDVPLLGRREAGSPR